MNSSKTVVKVVKSGVRFNAWDANGNSIPHKSTTGARKKYTNNMYVGTESQ